MLTLHYQGSDDSFGTFPEVRRTFLDKITGVIWTSLITRVVQDFKKHLSSELADHHVESVIYPQYATKGELTEASINFLEW